MNDKHKNECKDPNCPIKKPHCHMTVRSASAAVKTNDEQPNFSATDNNDK